MRFSTLIAFILPLSALAAPLTVPNENVENLSKLLEGITKAAAIYSETLSLPLDNSSLSADISFLQANLAVIPIAGVVDRVSKAVADGQKPVDAEYVDITY